MTFCIHEAKVAQLCSTLSDPMDCSPQGSSLSMGILQARILEWVAIPSSRVSSQHRNRTQVSHIAGGLFTFFFFCIHGVVFFYLAFLPSLLQGSSMFYHVSVLYFFLSACDAGDQGLIPGLGSSSGEGNGNPLQYPCLENPMDRGAWRATGHRAAKSRTRLSG